jgi:hypothetical protein
MGAVRERCGVSASDGHAVDPQPEHGAFDVCLHCKKAIQLDVYGSGRLVTMIGRNFECYAR